jgi:hypothetical protein
MYMYETEGTPSEACRALGAQAHYAEKLLHLPWSAVLAPGSPLLESGGGGGGGGGGDGGGSGGMEGGETAGTLFACFAEVRGVRGRGRGAERRGEGGREKGAVCLIGWLVGWGGVCGVGWGAVRCGVGAAAKTREEARLC